MYIEDADGFIRFKKVGSPSNAEVSRVAGQIVRRIEKLMSRRGLEPDTLEMEQNSWLFLAELYGASVTGRVLSGRRAGQKAVRVGELENEHGNENVSSPRCVNVEVVGLHANTATPAQTRLG